VGDLDIVSYQYQSDLRRTRPNLLRNHYYSN